MAKRSRSVLEVLARCPVIRHASVYCGSYHIGPSRFSVLWVVSHSSATLQCTVGRIT